MKLKRKMLFVQLAFFSWKKFKLGSSIQVYNFPSPKLPVLLAQTMVDMEERNTNHLIVFVAL